VRDQSVPKINSASEYFSYKLLCTTTYLKDCGKG